MNETKNLFYPERGNARHTGGESLATAIERMKAITQPKTSNPNASGIEGSENQTKREYQRLTMQRYKWNLQLDALGLPRIARGRQNLPDTFAEYIEEQGYKGKQPEAAKVIDTGQKQAIFEQIEAIQGQLDSFKNALEFLFDSP